MFSGQSLLRSFLWRAGPLFASLGFLASRGPQIDAETANYKARVAAVNQRV